MSEDRWTRPQPVDDVLLAFPADVADLMPAMEEIPAEFRSLHASTPESTKWLQLQRDWFYRGLKDPKFHCRPDIDGETAYRHLKAIQGSFQPKHEHKQAAVAYLASRWFSEVEYEVEEPR